MTNITIFTMIALTSILLLGTYQTFAQTIAQDDFELTKAKAIPDWVKFNMQSYLDEQISERELLDAFKFLEDKGIMHKSQEAAREMADLRTENTALKKKLDVDGIIQPKTNAGDNVPPGSQITPSQTPVIVMPASADDKEEALNHLRKAYDLNPNLQTKIMQYDKDHKDWIIIESWSWGESTAGNPDRPIVTGRVYNSGEEIYPDEYGTTSSSDDMTLKGSKIHENAPAHDEGAVIVFTGLEFASETVHDLVTKGDTSTTGWDEGIAAFKKGNYGTSSTTTSTSIHELGHALGVFCTVAMDKEVQKHETDLEFLKELSDAVQEDSETTTGAAGSTSRLTTGTTMTNIFQELALERAEKLEKKVDSLQVGMDICNTELKNLEDELQTAGDDAQLANIDLQNMLQKHQQSMQMMSNMMKAQHDTLKAIISNMKA